LTSSVGAQTEPVDSSNKPTTEPLFRISRAPEDVKPQTAPAAEIANASNALNASIATTSQPTVAAHPLDPAIELAKDRLEAIRKDIHDYRAIMVKRERIEGELRDPEFMKLLVRNRRNNEAGAIPFSVYMRFLKPQAIRGREVIYVEGQYEGKIVAHDTGLAGLMTVHLDPTGWMAMKNSRYPIYDAGIENLVVKLIEKAERDKAAGDCQVEFIETAKVNDRPCTKIKVVHPEQKAPYDFHIAEVYIDKELQVPIRYAAYTWPEKEGGEPVLLEEYTYLKLELNVGLTARDFDPTNPNYDYR
jgi:hypothetical protein